MFTGLVVERGRLAEAPAASQHGGVRLVIEHSAQVGERLSLGASLAVAGVCLTVIEGDARRSVVEVSPETLARTTLGRRQAGDLVNLEPPLRVGDAMGGHWVQGHVDGTVAVLARSDHGDHRTLSFELPKQFFQVIVEKGSVTIDGVSLTVSALSHDRFDVALIPHTLDETTLGLLEPGDRVHLEVDILAKMVSNLVARVLEGRGLGSPPLPSS